MKNNIFIFSSVGSDLDDEYKDQIFRSWNINTFDSGCVIYNENFAYSNYFKHTLTRSGFKFPNFFYFDDLFKVTDNYEYICILDDDLLFKEPNSIIETTSKMKTFNISVCSLSNNFEGKPSPYNIMRSGNPDEPRIAITNFCEMGCMILHSNFLKLVKRKYFKNYPLLIDFGFDCFICSLANNTNHIIGIIKYLSFFNPVQPHRNKGRHNWVNYKNSIKYIHPIIHRYIDVTN